MEKPVGSNVALLMKKCYTYFIEAKDSPSARYKSNTFIIDRVSLLAPNLFLGARIHFLPIALFNF